MSRRVLRALLTPVLVALVVVAGCKARADVLVQVEPDGSGVVTVTATLDAEAAERVGTDLSTALRLDDLEAAGWTVTPPATKGTDTVVVVSKPLAAADRLGGVMDELGPFSGWTLTSENSFTVSSYELQGKVTLTGSLDQFSDAKVAAALDGFALGRPPAEIEADLKADPGSLVLGVTAELPGEIDDASGLATVDPGDTDTVSASYELGSGTAVDTDVSVSSSSHDRSAVLWVLVGAGLVVAAVMLFLASRGHSRRTRVRTIPDTVRGDR